MTREGTTRIVDRLASKLQELESSVMLDTEEAIDQFEEHRQGLREALPDLPERLLALEGELGLEGHDLKQQLDELEVQLALARMETEEAYREQRGRIMKALYAMESTMQRIEMAEDSEGLLHLKNFVKRARRLEDKLGALDVHFALAKTHAGEALAREKEALKGKVGELGEKLKSAEAVAAHDVDAIENNIREGSGIIWDCLKYFMQYIETEDQRREREEMESRTID